MRKKILLVILSFAVSMVAAPNAQAASAKVGAVCKKSGAQITAGGKRLICNRVGKKLIWQIFAAPDKIQVVSPSLAVAGTRCAKAGLESFTRQGPLRCASGQWTLVQEVDDSVATRAFRSVLARYNANAARELALTFVLQPDLPKYLLQIQTGMLAAAKLWDVAETPAEPYPVLIGTNYAWLKKAATDLGLVTYDQMWENISRQASCSYAEFVLESQPWYIYCFGDGQQYGIGFLQVGAHEYTHLAQFAALDAFTDSDKRQMVPWYQEGMASFVGAALGFASGGGNDLRSLWISYLAVTTTKLASYSVSFPADWSDVYPLGAVAAEGLVALIGINGAEDILLECARANDFEEAMLNSTGISVPEWTELLQVYVDSVKAGKPLSIAELQAKANSFQRLP